MSESIKPLRNKVVVKPLKIKEVTEKGIIRPNTKEKPIEGEVLAIGSGILTLEGQVVPLEVSVGDVVLYLKHGGVEVKVNNEDLLILNEEEILAIKKVK
jgi:chaperonin GroES